MALLQTMSIASPSMSKNSPSSLLLKYKSTNAVFFKASHKIMKSRYMRKWCSRSANAVLGQEELKSGIAKFYDESSGLWENMWGEHMHHGFYPPGVKVDHKQAQLDMIENSLAFAGIKDSFQPKNIVDVGCGIGGSSRYLANKFKAASVVGITLSPVQESRGNELCVKMGLSDRVQLRVADALNMPFLENHYDLVWSMESGEHMPDKQKFVSELVRVAAPGGKIILVTWCHRNLGEEESQLKADEKSLLDQICEAYYLPEWCSRDDYQKLMSAEGLVDIKSADWTEFVAPFWPAVIQSALSIRGLLGLFQTGLTTIRGAFAMALMVQGFNRGLIKFVILTAEAPADST